ncbi:DNA polymerase III subunit delta' [Gloeobacter kilaueensis]|uniref:DNA polymerase III subunit delta n=1 Tax=Gloeobacter kilaueensis (strain ATCC BAA-2537 / CCAP 1431/1 / ULC 316 / JS1) TaxID=1183438 RepID=U5QNJ9_GLOK1|nr:DNA polymerase III subunit delta' [Gloeobacter kilaueensis]AGY60501.1 DNA polymerase III subunit delta' [Gloeobacter kilaueensis JS1]
MNAAVRGQPLAMTLLERALATGRIAPAYLFSGPQGVGRALAARAFAAALLESPVGRIERGNHPDLLWMEPTYKKGDRLLTRAEAIADGALPRSLPQVRLEQIRAITIFLGRPPVERTRQVIVIDGAEAMGEAAANALLKTLEEPGAGVFVLIAQSGARLLPTVRSRCQKIPFYCLGADLVAEILAAHRATVSAEVLAMAQGSPGRALELVAWLESVPAELLAEVRQWAKQPVDLRTALGLARRIDGQLALEVQIPLVDYLEHLVWNSGSFDSTARLEQLEALRGQLTGYVSPRLAWEVALAGLKR